jgi:hypothetical protein
VEQIDFRATGDELNSGLLTFQLSGDILRLHGKGGRSKYMKNSDCSGKREVAEA